jgi:hypothetical protein
MAATFAGCRQESSEAYEIAIGPVHSLGLRTSLSVSRRTWTGNENLVPACASGAEPEDRRGFNCLGCRSIVLRQGRRLPRPRFRAQPSLARAQLLNERRAA